MRRGTPGLRNYLFTAVLQSESVARTKHKRRSVFLIRERPSRTGYQATLKPARLHMRLFLADKGGITSRRWRQPRPRRASRGPATNYEHTRAKDGFRLGLCRRIAYRSGFSPAWFCSCPPHQLVSCSFSFPLSRAHGFFAPSLPCGLTLPTVPDLSLLAAAVGGFDSLGLCCFLK